ncbi:MAG TPA: hypothetical protein VFG30_06315 [Polyangiales bacterium]|jgi:hypothetical protein|nr:hypothetical protein [Polyangiales bacterium]
MRMVMIVIAVVRVVVVMIAITFERLLALARRVHGFVGNAMTSVVHPTRGGANFLFEALVRTVDTVCHALGLAFVAGTLVRVTRARRFAIAARHSQ